MQALLALMINAVEAMPEGGELTLRTAPGETDPERQVLLAVEDTGTGIPEPIRGRIFDPFFSTKAETSGVGSRARGRVRHRQSPRGDHSCGVRARSRAATFLIELPREPVAAPPSTYELDISEWRT